MAVLIKGMEMPNNCRDCWHSLCCKYTLTGDERYYSKSDDCPLVPVPEHGRLIDADALVRELTSIRASFGSANGLVEGGLNIAVSTVNGRSTIIPAEEGE